ncbi:MAG: major capsid protein [Microvirus sp.]|nr:MAG: major capsid protein [Microvirus sp.]
MHRNRSAQTHHFSMTPRADVPRSSFSIQKTHKTTFDSGQLIPFYVDEILPGDSFNMKATMFARLATPIAPIMDNLYLDTFFFFVPNRLVWNNWQKFMGEQEKPGDSISYIVPEITSPVGGYDPLTIFDYMGLPTKGQVDPTKSVTHSCMWLRAYNLIFNEWFRDENLVLPSNIDKGDGPDSLAGYQLRRRGKRHDYFTSCLPFTQKGTAVTIPLGTTAPIFLQPGANPGGSYWRKSSDGTTTAAGPVTGTANGEVQVNGVPAVWNPQGTLFADLSQASAATINQLRTSFQIQKLLERDARGGTRYAEIIRSHFGVISPDARLQRPEYLGGGTTPIVINPIAQTSATDQAGATTPLGNLAAMGTGLASGHGFNQAFTEHGMIIGLCSVRADLSYQQGLRRMWSRKTRYDFYFPAFSHLGEQSVLNKEIYCRGDDQDDVVFGYQERWSEYRYNPSNITGLFRSTTTGTIDLWHLAQRFTTLPTLNGTFIVDTPPLERVLAVGPAALGQQIIMDSFFDIKAARPLPAYGVPGLIDHF